MIDAKTAWACDTMEPVNIQLMAARYLCPMNDRVLQNYDSRLSSVTQIDRQTDRQTYICRYGHTSFASFWTTTGQHSLRYFSRYAGNSILNELSSSSPCGLQSFVNSGSFQPSGTSSSSVDLLPANNTNTTHSAMNISGASVSVIKYRGIDYIMCPFSWK